MYNSKCKKYLGGAGNVAKNISSLGGNVSLLTLVGNDKAGETIKLMLKESNVTWIKTNIFSDSTIRKIRFIANQQHLLRHDIETKIDLVPKQARERKIVKALSNSFGFGGTNASLVVGKLN